MNIDILDYRYFGQKRPKMIQKTVFLLCKSNWNVLRPTTLKGPFEGTIARLCE